MSQMTREELKGKQTKGVMHLSGVGAEVYGGKNGMHLVKIRQDGYEYRADAALYAEAHNVANSTGMWPQDLVDRVKELEACVESLLPLAQRIHAACDKGDVLNYDNDHDAADAIEYEGVITSARAILNKHNP